MTNPDRNELAIMHALDGIAGTIRNEWGMTSNLEELDAATLTLKRFAMDHMLYQRGVRGFGTWDPKETHTVTLTLQPGSFAAATHQGPVPTPDDREVLPR